MEIALNQRAAVAVFFGVAAFVGTLLFYGNQVNYVLLGFSVTLTMAGIAVLRLRVELPGLAVLWLWISTLGILFAFLVSPSADSSFPALWVLALTPLAAVLGMALGAFRTQLWVMIGTIVLILAAVSAVRVVVHGTRPQAPLTDPNVYGAVLYVILIMLAGKLLDLKWRAVGSPLWFLGLFAVSLLVFVIAGTLSRACIVIVPAAALFWFVFALRHHLDLRPVVVLAGAGVFGAVLYSAVDALHFVTGTPESASGGVSVRMTLIEAALDMYREHGLAGIGLYVFPLLYRQVRTPLDSESAGLFVHNDYVQLLVEGGPLLVAPFAALVALASVVLWRSLNRKSGRDSVGPAGSALAMAALLAHATINFVFYTPVLGFLLGLLVASASGLPLSAVGRSAIRSMPGAALLPLVLLLIAGWAHLWLDITTSVKLQGQPGIPFVLQPLGDQTDVLDYARLAQKLNPERGMPFLAEAVILDRSRLAESDDSTKAILEAYRRAIQVDPWNTHAWWQLRDFVLRTNSVKGHLMPQEHPAAITLEVLRLDPIFVPAIEARLSELATDDVVDTRASRLEFLGEHVGPNLTWLARQDSVVALRYVDMLLRYSASAADATHWADVREQVMAIIPLTPERWLVKGSG